MHMQQSTQIVSACRLGLGGKMDDLMDTSDLVSDADFLPNASTPAKPTGKGAPELLSDMSGMIETTLPSILSHAILQQRPCAV